MDRILLPWDGSGGFLPHAVHFAIEFAKRTGARLLFLAMDPDRLRGPLPDPNDSSDLERAISRARSEGLEVESYATSGDYVRQIAAFARDHRVSRVVIALPEVGGTDAARVEERVGTLREHLGCVLVTVRPRRGRVPAVSMGDDGRTAAPLGHEER